MISFFLISMVVQSLENLEILEKSGNNILVRENLEKSGNFTERARNVNGNNAFSFWSANFNNSVGKLIKL